MLFCLVLGTPLQYLPVIFRYFPDTGELGFPLTDCRSINAPTRTADPDNEAVSPASAFLTAR